MPPVTDDTLRRLATLRPGGAVLSLYLNLDPSEFGTQAARGAAIRSLLDHAGRQVEEAEVDHDARQALREDLERVQSYFRGEFSAKGAHGMAIFSAVRGGLFEAIALDGLTENRVVIDDRPYVSPLVDSTDPRDWFVVLVNRRDARFLRGNAQRLEEVGEVSDDVHGQHEQGGWSQRRYERSVDGEVEAHLQHVAEEVERQARRAPFERLLVGGPEELVPRFEERLGAALRQRLGGRVEVDVGHSTADEVRRAALPCFEDDERRRERQALDRLARGIASGGDSGGRAVAGLEAVLEALDERRVEILLYDEGYAPPGEPAVETAVEDALSQSATVLPVRHHPDLGPLGGIGAVLRF
ncbi:MAG: hypothetical protein M3296_03440 [Actinomycetota bacterium]|nr:hypothetical protein [Actinomycetota bacterium]